MLQLGPRRSEEQITELYQLLREGMVPRRGLEPPRLAAQVPETCASTNSAIWAATVHVRGRFRAVNWLFQKSCGQRNCRNGEGMPAARRRVNVVLRRRPGRRAWATSILRRLLRSSVIDEVRAGGLFQSALLFCPLFARMQAIANRYWDAGAVELDFRVANWRRPVF